MLSGLWTETAIVFGAVQALHDGYEIFVMEDGCGGLSPLGHANAMKRMVQAGAKPSTALSTVLELQRDWSTQATAAAVMDIVRAHGGRYGAGFDQPVPAPAPPEAAADT